MSTPLEFAWSWPDIDPASIDPTTVTVSRGPCGRWYVSFAVDVTDPEQLPATGAVVGVDLGIKDFAVTSDGEKIPNLRRLARRERNLARYQRRMARCQKGSANRAKARPRSPALTGRSARPGRLPAPRLDPDGPRPRRDRARGPGLQTGPQPVAAGDLAWFGSLRALGLIRGTGIPLINRITRILHAKRSTFSTAVTHGA